MRPGLVTLVGMAEPLGWPPGTEVARMRNGFTGLVVGGVLVLVAACSGSGGATGSTAAAASAEGSPADGGAGAEASVAAPASAAPAGGGGGPAGNVCELVTEQELAGILGTQIKSAVLTGPPDTCDIQSADGAPLAATVYLNVGGSFAYEAFAGDPGSVDVAGIGEKASYSSSQGLLVVFKNGAMLSIAVFDDGTKDEAARRALMEQIGKIAAGRM